MIHRRRKYYLIGTVIGDGFDCHSGLMYSETGTYNKVSHWVDWIRMQMFLLGDSVCGTKNGFINFK